MIAVDFEPSKHRNIDHGKPRRALAGRSRPLKTIFPVAGDPRPTSPTLFAKRVSEPRNLETSNSKHRTRNIETSKVRVARCVSHTRSRDARLPDGSDRRKPFFLSRWGPGRLPRHFSRNAFLKPRNIETSKHRRESHSPAGVSPHVWYKGGDILRCLTDFGALPRTGKMADGHQISGDGQRLGGHRACSFLRRSERFSF